MFILYTKVTLKVKQYFNVYQNIAAAYEATCEVGALNGSGDSSIAKMIEIHLHL